MSTYRKSTTTNAVHAGRMSSWKRTTNHHSAEPTGKDVHVESRQPVRVQSMLWYVVQEENHQPPQRTTRCERCPCRKPTTTTNAEHAWQGFVQQRQAKNMNCWKSCHEFHQACCVFSIMLLCWEKELSTKKVKNTCYCRAPFSCQLESSVLLPCCFLTFKKSAQIFNDPSLLFFHF